MKNANVEKAAKVIRDELDYGVPSYEAWRGAAERLDAAGLLVTPEMTACVEACREYTRKFGKGLMADNNVVAAGHAILAQEAARKPEESWTAHPAVNGSTYYITRDNMHGPICTGLSKKEAEAAVAAMNAANNYVSELTGVKP